MIERFMDAIRCPACRNSPKVQVFEGNPSKGYISAGIFICDCGEKYPIWKGVPRMLMPGQRVIPRAYLAKFEAPLRRLAPEFFEEETKTRNYSFDTQWSMYEYGELTWETDITTRVNTFYDEIFRIPRGSLGGALVLDAGCGNGTLSAALAATGPEIIGLDYSESVERAEAEKERFAGKAADRVHYVQGDVQRPPFAPETFDLIYSDGVLHHTPSTRASFNAIAPLVKPDGRIYVMLYRRDAPPIYNIKMRTAKALQVLLRPLPLQVTKCLCFAGAGVLLARIRILHLFGNRRRPLVPLRLRAVNLFDTLTPRYYHLHTASEVQEWFASAGFSNSVVDIRPPLCYSGFGVTAVRRQQMPATSAHAGLA